MGFSMTMKSVLAAVAAGLTLALSGTAFANDGWTGEGSLSAGVTSGNTKTTDAAAGLKVANQFGEWRAKGDLVAEYGETSNNETKNRYKVGAQLDRDFDATWYGFGRASYEEDKFAAFDTRTFAGIGVGVKVIAEEATKLTLEFGPGYRWDELANGTEEEDISVRGAAFYKHEFNEAVAFSNDLEVLYADVSTQVFNSTGLTAKLTDTLAARVSYDVRHETDVLPGRKETDTATRVSLVYGF
jgi:putative salt-induced outer membrane protein